MLGMKAEYGMWNSGARIDNKINRPAKQILKIMIENVLQKE